MTELGKHLPDVSTFAANIVVFLAAIGAAVVGSMSMVKKIKEGWIDLAGAKATPAVPTAQVVGGMLQDTFGSVMMAEQVRNLNARLEEMKDAVAENTRELRENRHQMERLMDRMDRR